MDLLKSQAIRWGTKLIESDADIIDINKHPFCITTSDSSSKEIKTNSLVIATGASANKLNLPSESKFWSKGISACAICDGATPQFRKEELAVVGGGDSACEEAVYLTKYGSHVHLLVRSNKLRASAAMADRVLLNKDITIHFSTELIDIQGEGWLQTLKVKRLGSRNHEDIEVKGLFYAIGHTPNTEILKNQLELNKHGYIVTKPGRPETSIEGVFAAGDVADSEWRQGVTAAASGCKAALAAEKWLSKNNLASLIHRDLAEPASTPKNIPTEISDQNNFKSDAIWQKGSYALRKLYHESEIPLLVIYTSPNCGPCHVLKPQIKRVLKELEGKAQAVEIDIEIDPNIAEQAKVNGTPTVQLFKLKELKEEWKGVKQRSDFKNSILKLINQ